MKLTIEMGTELACLFILCMQFAAIEVIFNYIAIIVITELDEVYYQSIHTPLKE